MGRIDIATGISKKDWKHNLPGLVVSAICLAVILAFVDFQKLGQALKLADYRIIAVSASLTLIWLLVRAALWKTLLKNHATFSQAFLTINEGYLINNIFPLRLGEVARSYLLGRKANLPFWQVFSTILIERALDIALAVGLLLISLPFVIADREHSSADWAGQAALVSGSVVLAGLICLYLMALHQKTTMDWFLTITHRWPRLSQVGGKALSTFLSGLSILNSGSLFLQSLAWILLNWAIAVFQYFLLMRAFLPDPQPAWAGFTLALAALGMAAPSSPGGVGVYEAAVVGALSLFGVDPSISVAFAITAHLLNYLITGCLGIYGLGRDGESLSGLYYQVKSFGTPR